MMNKANILGTAMSNPGPATPISKGSVVAISAMSWKLRRHYLVLPGSLLIQCLGKIESREPVVLWKNPRRNPSLLQLWNSFRMF